MAFQPLQDEDRATQRLLWSTSDFHPIRFTSTSCSPPTHELDTSLTSPTATRHHDRFLLFPLDV